MDDKQRAQGLKAIARAAVAADAALLELEDICTNGCGCPETVEAAKGAIRQGKEDLNEAHRIIRTAHIVKAAREEGAPLPFAEGPESTRVPAGGGKGRKRKGKEAAAGPDAD